MKPAALIIILLTTCCNLAKGQAATQQTFTLKQFRDTTLNGISLKFTEISEKDYKSLKTIETEIPLQSATSLFTKTDSCQFLKLENGKTDTLCNKRRGDSFEEYQVRGYWKQNHLVLVSYLDWEESGNDFFINLKDGGYYNLTHHYKLSPDHRFIFSFVGINELVWIPSVLLLTECGIGVITTKLYIDLGQLVVTDLSWLTKNECIITAGVVEANSFSVNNVKIFKLSMKF